MNESLNARSINYHEALFSQLRQNTVIMLDADGFVLEINTAFTSTFGYQPEDIVGQNFSILFTEDNRSKDLPRRELNTVLAQGQAFDNNYLVNKNNQLVWVIGESVLLHDSNGRPLILKIIYNVQVQKESEASILRLHEFNENILAFTEDVVLIINEEFKIEKANDAFYDLFSFAKDNTPIVFTKIIPQFAENLVVLNSLEETMITKKGFRNKILHFRVPDGEEKVFDAGCTHLNLSRSGSHLLLILHDITAHIASEREREDIIGFVAHELRNPLANIMLCNEMITRLVSEGKTQEIGDFVIRSKKNAMRLNRMVTGLYDVTKMNSGNFGLELSIFKLIDIVREAVQTIELLHPSYTINVTDESDGIAISGDPYRLIQVLDNFLTNGIKYSNGKTNIFILITLGNDMATISVKDEGLGIPPSQLPHIFKRFFRAEKTKNLEGIGLGLYLCREIILAHKGKIWAESEDGKGSNFCFSIPLTKKI